MKRAYLRYREAIDQRLKKAFMQENEILLAAKWIADSLSQNGWIYTSGTGHSHMMAEEIFYRAGGFARVIPLFDQDLMLHRCASGSSIIERKEGYAKGLISPFPITSKDIFILASNSGINAFCIDLALEAKKRNAKIICITNLKHSKTIPSRHSSGLKLFQVADLFLDNCGEVGDAVIEMDQLDKKVGATSTVIGAALLQAIMVQATEMMLKNGFTPEIFHSSNDEKGDIENRALVMKYRNSIPSL
ncbi:SIS domain-containing protein [Algoriphagus sp. CAU 1675]|uniref:SIS domain-containing protein n=1 Tax=Algoriphagus sp. CAU 1675 TaxID=3032597 RepID=UPI0023DA6FCF|nr:SIS domain-containing protein [Algoriphagus sp. CAU 1675]MDF2159330.1 SIS domain-containing protein [Algoriphagus sp. CAU 1675]